MEKWKILILCTLFTFTGCDEAPPPVPSGWSTISAGSAFTFMAPPDLAAVPAQGIDSFVGRYRSPTLEIDYDYGWYSDPLNEEGFESKSVTVDGRSARLAHKGNIVGIHFPKVGGKTRLTMRVTLSEAADRENAESILRSIRFH